MTMSSASLVSSTLRPALSVPLIWLNSAARRCARMQRMRNSRLTLVALFAVLAVLLQPVCATYAAAQDTAAIHSAAQDSGDDGPCCSDVDSASFVAPSSASFAKVLIAATEATIAIPRAAWVEQAPLLDRPVAWHSPPPPPLPYHARSARILR